jgi:hypothetical protein
MFGTFAVIGIVILYAKLIHGIGKFPMPTVELPILNTFGYNMLRNNLQLYTKFIRFTLYFTQFNIITTICILLF